ncbi:MAG: bifunctional diaminohydroxyphosphoribosylaminopyrimidine deaminase/5-amino-6-(5-phosphoribosylamino)uracil reductase RibD [Mycobacteriaceae bacterium]
MNLEQALVLASVAGASVRGTTSPNPPVGAVILDAAGDLVGTGATAPAGGPHAEIIALREAGLRARGGSAVTTLEPCNHTGRTGPCTEALLRAGIAHVHFAAPDPTPTAGGGAVRLQAAGVTTSTTGTDPVELRAWLHRQRTGRPHVTWKLAASLDGRTAAADGTSRWITGAQARAQVHAERGRIDAIVVGTGTVLADDPALTARSPDGTLAAHQPLRVVVGHRPLPVGARALDDAAESLVLRTHDPHAVLAALGDHPDVLLEGGATLAGAFVAAGLVDRVVAYLAPVLLGAGPAALGDAGVVTIGQALRFDVESVNRVGDDVRIDLVPRAAGAG